MKKMLLVSMVLAVVAVFTLGSVSTVSASSGAPVANDTTAEFGFGGRGGRMGGNGSGGTGTGILDEFMHDEMLQVFADELGISAETLESRLDGGETMSAIALSQGLTIDEFDALMDQAREAALAQAVSDGVLTQTQADSFQDTGPMMSFGGTGYRGANGSGACLGL